MRRIVLTLTEAQAAWLRGAVVTHGEEMAVAEMASKSDEKHLDEILRQLRQPAKEVAVDRPPAKV